MKAILLAGGTGSRLYPLTLAISKQLLPVGDKPLIYYPLSVLMLAGIREIILICNSSDLESYEKLFGDGSEFGLSMVYVVQPKPEGIAQAFLLAEEYIAGRPVALALGDNIFYGHGFSRLLQTVIQFQTGATLFGYRVSDPERFGIIECDKSGRALSIEEKPLKPKSDCAVTGLYFYDSQALAFAKDLIPSSRGELEITDINRRYLEKQQINVEILGRGFAWLDTGTHKAMADAGVFINSIEARQGLKVACLEEIAFRNGWIDLERLKRRGQRMAGSEYGLYLTRLVRQLESK